MGQCRHVRITCVSEIGWFDGVKLVQQVMSAPNQFETSQWAIPWDSHNAAGSCALIDVEMLDGQHHKILLDTGWSTQYMDKAFQREGIDTMLKNREIDCLVISHEHLDHYWGIETTLKYCPDLKIFTPATFYPEGFELLEGGAFTQANCANHIPHQGELVKTEPGSINQLFPGVVLVNFDIPITLRVRGEQSLYFNLKDKGMVCVTGCCHQNVLNLSNYAINNLVDGDNLYGLYGGLHISPHGPLNAESEAVVEQMGQYKYQRIACNHCTGLPAVQKMRELGYPLVSGTGQHGSMSNLHVGNGDRVEF